MGKAVPIFEWTFYGIANNTEAAAMTFEMAYNLILKSSMLKNGASTKHSYSMGVADGLYRLCSFSIGTKTRSL